MKLFVFALFAATTAAIDLSGQHKTYAGYKVYELTPSDEVGVKKIRDMAADQELDFWVESRRVGAVSRVMVPPHRADKVDSYVSEHGIHSNVMVEDVSVKVMAELERLRARQTRDNLAFDIDDFNTYDDIMSELDLMAARCPAGITCTVETLGQSYEGRDIKVIRISGGAGRTGYWLDSAIHAREWLAPATLLKILDTMTRNYGVDTEVTSLIDSHDWHFVPVMNPDGYEYSWTTARFWRKSRNINEGSTCEGTDLNRNYDANWGNAGTSNEFCSDTFGGLSPASAIETQIIQAETVRLGPTLAAFLSIHTAAQTWLHPWGHTTETGQCVYAEDEDDLLYVNNIATDAVEATWGLPFERGNSCDTIYPASGLTMDYAKLVGGVKYAFTPEMRGPDFVIDKSEIELSFQETFNGVKAMVQAIADRP